MRQQDTKKGMKVNYEGKTATIQVILLNSAIITIDSAEVPRPTIRTPYSKLDPILTEKQWLKN